MTSAVGAFLNVICNDKTIIIKEAKSLSILI